MHQTAYNDAAAFVAKYLPNGTGLAADIGAYDYNGTLRPLFAGKCDRYDGIDIVSGPNVDIVVKRHFDWEEIASDTYDCVVSTQTLEHVRHPHWWIKEVYRICKPGGIVYVNAPNTMAYHECPIDCWRIWPEGMKALLEYAGFASIETYKNDHGDTTGIGRKP